MKCFGKIAIGLAGGLVLIAGARADNVASAGNPYTAIVARNIFGLNPVQADEAPGEPPPKITLNGIMSTYGKLQALFKVAGSGRPGQPDQSYMLNEGQRKDDIEVMQINDSSNLVTFNNHGTVQEISLANAPAGAGAGPGQGGLGSRGGNLAKSMGGSGGAGGNIIGNSSPRSGSGRLNRGGGNSGNNLNNAALNNGAFNNGMGGGSTLSSVPARAGYSNQEQPQNTQTQTPLSPEEQAILIEAQRSEWEKQGNPAATFLPPTALTSLLKPPEKPGGGPPAPP